MLAIVIQLISGALGGNIVGALAKRLDMGPLWNTIAGIAGGGIGGQLVGTLGIGGATAAVTGGNLDIASILASVAGGGVGGGLLMTIVGFIKQAMGRSK